MFAWHKVNSLASVKLAALDRAFAIAEFSPTGEFLSGNPSFLDLMGYQPGDLIDAHHRLFVEAAEAQRESDSEFWERLARGECMAGEFRRLRRDGAKVFVRGAYMPVADKKGRIVQILQVVLDVTAERLAALDATTKFNAVATTHGVVEFDPNGTILTMNRPILQILGYDLDDVVGKPHAMLVDPDYAQSEEYAEFWERLRAGEPIAGSFPRLGRNNKPILVQGAYSPIRDVDGRVVRIVKIAKDLTDLRVLGVGLAAVSLGNLACRIEEPFQSDFEGVRSDFNATVDAISDILRQIFESIIVFGEAADHIASAADSLARRTEDQAANLEMAAASLDEVSGTVNFTSASATRAAAAVQTAKQDALNGGDVVGRAVEAMSRIEKSSREIGSIIGVVDEIAFQTNLLALNAGVEAARAGDAGRGFAVVAAEVRTLAQRSAEAAKQIKSLVTASAADVSAGVGLVRETGASLRIIVDQVVELDRLIHSITNSAKEEASILTEVNSSVNLVDEATQQNSAIAEETAASIKSFKIQIETLLGAVNQFKLPDGGLPQMAAEHVAATSRAA